jgi:hypothetical protein
VTVYSTLLGSGISSAESLLLYTTPSGYVAVVRDVEYYNLTSAELNAHLQLAPSGLPGFYGCTLSGLQPGNGGTWQGRIVLPSGSYIYLPPFGTGLYAGVSGYVLDA